MGERKSVIGPRRPASRILSMFAIRESANRATPPASITSAISGHPSAALVTPVTEIPRSPNRSTRARALCWILPRSMSSRGAVTQVGHELPLELRERRATMSRSSPAGRVSASVTGMPSSRWYDTMAASMAASDMFSWLIVKPMTFVSAKVSMRLISVAGSGIAICS